MMQFRMKKKTFAIIIGSFILGILLICWAGMDLTSWQARSQGMLLLVFGIISLAIGISSFYVVYPLVPYLVPKRIGAEYKIMPVLFSEPGPRKDVTVTAIVNGKWTTMLSLNDFAPEERQEIADLIKRIAITLREEVAPTVKISFGIKVIKREDGSFFIRDKG